MRTVWAPHPPRPSRPFYLIAEQTGLSMRTLYRLTEEDPDSIWLEVADAVLTGLGRPDLYSLYYGDVEIRMTRPSVASR